MQLKTRDLFGNLESRFEKRRHHRIRIDVPDNECEGECYHTDHRIRITLRRESEFASGDSALIPDRLVIVFPG